MRPDDMKDHARPRHRKSGFLARLIFWQRDTPAETRPEPEPEYSPEILVSCDGAYAYSEPLIIGEGHPYRYVNCLICFEMPSEHAVRLISVFDPRVKESPTWRIHSRGYLICVFHGLPSGDMLAQLAHTRDYPNCDCRQRSLEALPVLSHFAGNGGFIA